MWTDCEYYILTITRCDALFVSRATYGALASSSLYAADVNGTRGALAMVNRSITQDQGRMGCRLSASLCRQDWYHYHVRRDRCED